MLQPGELVLWQWLILFTIAAAAVIGAGVILARAGDTIAGRTALGGLFVGMLLMAGATSLPEIVTDVSAALAGAPDLALGDLFGSSMANMAILAVIDLVHRGRVWPSAGLGQARIAAIGIALTSVLLIGIVMPTRIQIGWIGLESVVVVVAYILAAAWIRRAQRAGAREQPPEVGDEVFTPIGLERADGSRSLRRPLLLFGAGALVVLLAAPVMALAAEGIARETGIGQTFLGLTLLATATSLPELATSIAAVRIGAYALAVGNLLGSNAINPTIILFADLAYTPGPILGAVSSGQLLAGLGAILLMAIGMGGIVHGARTRFERGEPDALLLLLAYVALLWLVWSGS